MELANFILQCFVLVFVLVIAVETVRKSIKKVPDTLTKKAELFQQGSQQTWSLITVALYKMWADHDILDFDSLQARLQFTLQELTKEPEQFEEWHKKFNVYMKEKHNESD